MAGARKLQAEIDRCLKKVAEGVEKFEETWQKVHNSSNSNQKVLEKYEEDLKKEIKKLQRLRDQIKTWLASGEIKDKSTLMENRKLIETQMERFKIVERETKTKAYSKEGLTASTRMDPAEREKAEVMQWLNHCIDTLNIQVDQFEAEIESLQGGGKKRKGKSDDAARQEECQVWVDKHRDHIQKLETLLRMLDNTQVEVTQIKDIKEDIDNYIENSQEPDFFENEYIYDDIDGLEEMLLDLGAPEHNSVEASETASSTNSVSGNSPVPGQTGNHNHSSEASNSLPSHQDDLKRRHRSSQSDDSKSAKKSGSSSGVAVTPSGGDRGSCGGGLGSSPSLAPSQVAPPSPLPVRPVSSTPTKSAGPITQYCLSQSPNNSSPSSGPSALLAGLTNHLQQDRQQNFAAAAATQNGHPSGDSGREGSVPSPPPFHAGSHSPTHSAAISGPVLTSLGSIGSFPKLMNNVGSLGSLDRPPLSQVDGAVSQGLGSSTSTSSIGSIGSMPPGLPQPGSYPHPGGLSGLGGRQDMLASSLSSGMGQIQMGQQPSQDRGHVGQVQVNGGSTQQNLQGLQHQQKALPESLSSLKSLAQQALSAVPAEPGQNTNQPPGMPGQTGGTEYQAVTPGYPAGYLDLSGGLSVLSKEMSGLVDRQRSGQKTEAHIPPLLGVAPLGIVPLSKEHQFQYSMLEAASHHLPHPSDSERLRPYLPRNPCHTPHYYPQAPPPGSDTIDFFQRLSTETLFFIFYYMEGTKAQYLAAKALKKQSWRFHTKYMMWFQRHEEPKIINDEYEQGTYIYFDYEKWGQRKKEGFTFEYRFLEDRDLN
eukprot:GFUD01016696.1.p1 GENE.GFUD01016696.1~~GFUD01016696.1.p1  ORF type:complete len:817 (+),score=229.71 GFUD01016696.1:113-2563(+)